MVTGDVAVHGGGCRAGEPVAGGAGHHAVSAAVPQCQHAPGPHCRLPGEGDSRCTHHFDMHQVHIVGY